MFVPLHSRTFAPELLDTEAYTDSEYVQCMRQLRLINILTSGYRPTIRAVAHFASTHSERRPMTVLDVGFGYGDTLRKLEHWAASRGIALDLAGIDLNPRAAAVAQEATPESSRIRFMTGDVLQHTPDQPYDVVVNSLFMHHLTDDQAVRMLRWMALHSRLGFSINDLHRHRVAYEFIRLFTRCFGFNRLIRNDAPLSVARSFRAGEWRAYAQRAGLDMRRLAVNWHWPFRYGVRYDHAR